jgi:hypothetical protein
MLNKKVHICDCGRKSYGFKKCGVCRAKSYNEKSKIRKANVSGGGEDIGSFFERHIKELKNREVKCAECGAVITNPDSKNVCHILPKSIFKSIATTDENILYMCWAHHSMYDSSWEKAKTMKIWPIVVSRVRAMSIIIKERHKILYNFD